METAEQAQYRLRLLVISLSLFVGAALMLSKFYVYWLTYSSAILSDAIESIINVVASGFALGSVILSAKPPDLTHPYGHGKIEFFSAGFEGALIIIAAFGIFWTAWPQLLHPHDLPHLGMGLLILFGTSGVNLGLALGLMYVGKRTQSLILVADGKHLLTDVFTSAGVLVGLVLVHQSGWYWLDGGVACLVGINILVVGAKLVKESFSGLMHASDPMLIEELSGLIASHRKPTWIEVHRLRAWRAGNRVHADFHLILPRDMSLEAAHHEASLLQDILNSHLGGNIEAVIHAEPCLEQECPICGYDPCRLRQAPTRLQNIWLPDLLTSPSEDDARELNPEHKHRTEHDEESDQKG